MQMCACPAITISSAIHVTKNIMSELGVQFTDTDKHAMTVLNEKIRRDRGKMSHLQQQNVLQLVEVKEYFCHLKKYLPVHAQDQTTIDQCKSAFFAAKEDDVLLLHVEDELGFIFSSKKNLTSNLANMIRDLPAEHIAVELDGTFKLTREKQ